MATTYISGEIDLAGVPNERKAQIKQMLESFFGTKYTEEVFRTDYLEFEEEWHSHEDTDNFMQLILKIVPLLDPKTVARLLCEGETHSDYWGAIIKKNTLYIQKYVLKPASDKREFVYKQS